MSAHTSGTTVTVVAVVLIVAGFLFIIGGAIFAWAVRRQPPAASPASFYNFLTHRSRASDDAISITSWNDEPYGRSSLWKYAAPPAKPERAYTTDPSPDYIPYNGPVEPPRLPLPMALRARVNRPLPPLPGEPRTVEHEQSSDLMGALLLRLGSKKRKTATMRPPQPQPPEASFTRQIDIRGDSMLSEASLVTTNSLRHSATASTAVTGKAVNGRRSAAKVLQYDADGISRPSSLRKSSSQTQLQTRSSPPPVPTLPAHKVKRKSLNAVVAQNQSSYHTLADSTDSFDSILAEYPSPPGVSRPGNSGSLLSPDPHPHNSTTPGRPQSTTAAVTVEDTGASPPPPVRAPQRLSEPIPQSPAQSPALVALVPQPIPPVPALPLVSIPSMPSMPAPVLRSNTTKTLHLAYDEDDRRSDPFADPAVASDIPLTR